MRITAPNMSIPRSSPQRPVLRRLYVLAGLLVAVLPTLAACSGTPPSAEQRAAAQDELNPSGRPYQGPPGTLSSMPPADSNFTPLFCHQEQQGAVCTRSR